MDVSAVLFDLDSTLCTHPTARSDALAAAFERAGVEPFCTLTELREAVERIGETASMPYRTYRACAELAADAGLERETGVAVAAALQAERPSRGAELTAGAERVLSRLQEQYALALVTNGGPDTQDPKLDALGIADYFEAVVLAGFDTASKPAPEPFERALGSLDVEPSETVHVGNSLAHDVAGAHAVGLEAVWVRPSPSATANGHTPAWTVDALPELLPPPWE